MADPPDDLPSFVGQRIREARLLRKLTQAQVGAVIDKDHSPIGQWERGETLPELPNLVAVAEFLGVSLDLLVWGMPNEFDARIRALPEILRTPLIDRIRRELDAAEMLAARLPAEFSGPTIADTDARMRRWSAAAKQAAERLRPKKAKSRSRD